MARPNVYSCEGLAMWSLLVTVLDKLRIQVLKPSATPRLTIFEMPFGKRNQSRYGVTDIDPRKTCSEINFSDETAMSFGNTHLNVQISLPYMFKNASIIHRAGREIFYIHYETSNRG